jgi:serine/threonine-protein kinase
MEIEAVTIGPIAFPEGDKECGPVADALTKAIASTLCAVPTLRVTDPGSRVDPGGAHGEPARVPAVGVDGSVRRSGNRIRVTLRVLDADGTMQWSRHADGTLDDVFALEDAVAGAVKEHFVERETLRSTPPGGAPPAGRRAVTEADRLVAEGLNAFARRGGGSSVEEAKAYLTRALALEPKHARGLCAMGNIWSVAAVTGQAPREEALARGRELIFAALAADDQCAEVHCSLGKLALYHDDDFHAASRHVRRATELDPADPEALRLLSIVNKILGRSGDSVNAARAATERFPDAPPLWNTLGDALLAAGRNAEAVDALKHAIRLMPSNALALERLELARTRLGEFALAVEIRVTRLKLAGQRDRVARLEQNVIALGAADAIRADVRLELNALLDDATRKDPFADHVGRSTADRIASGHAELGEWREAMDWVERSYEQRPGRLRRMLADMPVDYRGLAADPRYARLLRVAGLEELM